jgi:hypothetical protein
MRHVRSVYAERRLPHSVGMSWKRQKALTEAQIQEESGVKPVKLASVCIYVLQRNFFVIT